MAKTKKQKVHMPDNDLDTAQPPQGDGPPDERPVEEVLMRDHVETIKITHALPPDKVVELQTKISNLSVELLQREDELARINESKRAEMKPIKAELEWAVRTYASGTIEEEREAHRVVDAEKGEIVYRDPMTGVELERRPMTELERQLPLV